jgi:hypothetical protein
MAPWNTLASNQAITCNNLQNACSDGLFYQKNMIPPTDKCITKAEAEFYVDINPISGKTSNQLVVKSDLVSPGYYYGMDRYNCNTCNPDDIFPVAYSSVPLTFNYFYAGESPYTYRRLARTESTSYTLDFSTTTGTASCISCSTTTTTTTTAGFYYNNAYRNTCNGVDPCIDDGVEVILRSSAPLSNGSWYSDGFKSYQPYGSTSGPIFDIDIDPYISSQSANCEDACNNY